jgi:hypothetical protein
MTSPRRILFILKKRNNSYGISYGLLNSCRFVCKVLEKHLGELITCNVVEVNDANDIDREVHQFKPHFVIIEALFVTPKKFTELFKLHPKVIWSVRIHSKAPFLAQEGMAFDWINDYINFTNSNKKFSVSTNNKEFVTDLSLIYKTQVDYLPNLYPVTDGCTPPAPKQKGVIHIASFGAIRPLKNQLEQAIAAIIFADKEKKILKFHMNTTRVEQNGEPILKNIRNLFKGTAKHELVDHIWMKHDEFLKVVKTMQLGMQISFSESFNIITADFVDQCVPIITSIDIDWIGRLFQVNPTETDAIVNKLSYAYHLSTGEASKKKLIKFNDKSVKDWEKYLGL